MAIGGRGYAMEVAHGIVHFGFTELHLHMSVLVVYRAHISPLTGGSCHA